MVPPQSLTLPHWNMRYLDNIVPPAYQTLLFVPFPPSQLPPSLSLDPSSDHQRPPHAPRETGPQRHTSTISFWIQHI